MNTHVFWDNSNIWLVGRNVCKQKEPGNESAFRIHFANLFEIAANGRAVATAFVGGSEPPASDEIWTRFQNLRITVQRQERGSQTGKEVAVDEAIQLAMANAVLDADVPGTMILLTGDGAGYGDGKGFIKQLERAHKKGWKIEVVSWDAGCNSRLREFAATNGTYRALEPVYDKVTFIQGSRWVVPVVTSPRR
jgi:hypothetical protein